MKPCNECGKQIRIVNKFYGLCAKCNNKRLEKRKESSKGIKPAKHKTTSDRRKTVLKKDRETYFKLFLMSNHECENCGRQLPSEFEDEKGNLIAIHRYSHIIPKGARPDLRHDVDNFNILCLECHNKWEFGDRKTMNIFDKNKRKIDDLWQKKSRS